VVAPCLKAPDNLLGGPKDPSEGIPLYAPQNDNGIGPPNLLGTRHHHYVTKRELRRCQRQGAHIFDVPSLRQRAILACSGMSFWHGLTCKITFHSKRFEVSCPTGSPSCSLFIKAKANIKLIL
jgi:hypothetical protein